MLALTPVHEDKSSHTIIPYKSLCKIQLLKYMFAARLPERRPMMFRLHTVTRSEPHATTAQWVFSRAESSAI